MVFYLRVHQDILCLNVYFMFVAYYHLGIPVLKVAVVDVVKIIHLHGKCASLPNFSQGCCSSDISEAPVQRLVSIQGDTSCSRTSQLFNPNTATPFECAEFERCVQWHGIAKIVSLVSTTQAGAISSHLHYGYCYNVGT